MSAVGRVARAIVLDAFAAKQFQPGPKRIPCDPKQLVDSVNRVYEQKLQEGKNRNLLLFFNVHECTLL
jgi:hypothetical protein